MRRLIVELSRDGYRQELEGDVPDDLTDEDIMNIVRRYLKRNAICSTALRRVYTLCYYSE